MSTATELADAIVSLLNDEQNEFSVEFDARRRAVPIVKPEDSALKTVQVSVFAGVRSADRRARGGTRGGFAHIYKPVVAVQQKLEPSGEQAQLEAADELQLLVEEIETLLKLIDGPMAGLEFIGFDEATAERDAYSAELLRANSIFASIITLEFHD